MITLLDYGAGNVRSIRNAIRRLGYKVSDVSSPNDIIKATKLIFPGVGSFGSAMKVLHKKELIEALRDGSYAPVAYREEGKKGKHAYESTTRLGEAGEKNGALDEAQILSGGLQDAGKEGAT